LFNWSLPKEARQGRDFVGGVAEARSRVLQALPAHVSGERLTCERPEEPVKMVA
jgi:hypothetical protein